MSVSFFCAGTCEKLQSGMQFHSALSRVVSDVLPTPTLRVRRGAPDGNARKSAIAKSEF